jgi:hypothetical protein
MIYWWQFSEKRTTTRRSRKAAKVDQAKQERIKQRIIELANAGIITDTADIYLQGGLVAEVSICWDDAAPVLVDIITWGDYQGYAQLDQQEARYFKRTNTMQYWEALAAALE